jgi:hypothetical protein
MTEDVIWIPLSALAEEYQKSIRVMQYWASNGFLLELGYSLKRDATRHWIVGVKDSEFVKFAKNTKQSVVNQTQSL